MAPKRLDRRYRWVVPEDLQGRTEALRKRFEEEQAPSATLAATLAFVMQTGLDVLERKWNVQARAKARRGRRR